MNEIGDLRPSQLIYTFGVGALIDLPNMSALIMGLDDWDTRHCTEIIEERLLAAIQQKRGSQLKRLLLPPIAPDDNIRDVTAPAIGVPVVPFPRWLRCPACDMLATIESGAFSLKKNLWRPDKTGYVHANCNKARGGSPDALPVRFLLACREGHLADFPWIAYVHRRKTAPCVTSRLTLREYGAAGDASDIIVECIECKSQERMADAFDRKEFTMKCAAHHPHLRHTDDCGCKEEARTILLGASNSWFPMVMTALSIPTVGADKLAALIEEHWGALKDIPSLEVAKFVTAPSRLPALAEHSAEDIWAGIQKKKTGPSAAEEEPDLKVAEWKVLTGAKLPLASKNFSVKRVSAPQGYESQFEKTVLLEKLREVRALMAFTRIESKGDFAAAATEDDGRATPLGRSAPEWLPASEVRGEGIFLRFKESALQAWEANKSVQQLDQEFFGAHKQWRRLRNQEPASGGYPGSRFVLIHSLTHALMRQIALECGYTAASVRERIYCRGVGEKDGPMAGLMIYTAASDSEGTLGGLVQLGQPQTLGRLLDQALEEMRICGSDPLCAEHSPTGDGRGVHGACCHACLFAPETSCEKGNRFLDRTTLVATFASKGAEFFTGSGT